MSTFHRQCLLSWIRETHQVPVQSDWAYAIRKQARLILVPLFREVIVTWKEEKTGKRPFLTDLSEELFRGFFQNGSVRMSVHSQVKKIISKFLETLDKYELGVLGFYFLSKEGEVDAIFQEILVSDEFEESGKEDIDAEVGKVFQNRLDQLTRDELVGFLMEELGEIENIISNSDLEIGLDTEAITRINENFSNYLDIPNVEISLIQKPIDEWEFWKKVTAEEPETIGKRIHTDRGLEWVECWLLPDGRIRVKGDFLDEPDRDKVAIQAIGKELPVILKTVHDQLKERYQLLNNQIHYTFFTQRESLENILPSEGIDFFINQIEAHGADDFVGHINLSIRRYQHKVLQEWGTQIPVYLDLRHWLDEDETYEYKVWVLSIAQEETPLETTFSEEQIESIAHAILAEIHRCYQLDHENQ